MSTTVQHLLESFEALPEPEKHELASEILRWSAHAPHPDLADNELIRAADAIFLSLDLSEQSPDQTKRG